MIHPPYVHDDYLADDAPFVRDRLPFLPIGPLFASEMLERQGRGEPELFDCQLHDLREVSTLDAYDSFGINVMGAQNLAPASAVHRFLSQRVDPARVHLGGQGVEQLTPEEFSTVFPGSHQTPRQALAGLPGALDVGIARQVDKLSDDDLLLYLTHETTLPFSQGCLFGCSFCGAQIRRREEFFDTVSHLEMLCRAAQRLGVNSLNLYCTSLDFFQQALPGGRLAELTSRLEAIIAVKEQYGIDLQLHALTRADSYNAAMASAEVRDLVLTAGFNRFGFGADGAASADIVQAMRKHAPSLRSDLVTAFANAQEHGLVQEILYVFGIPEDTSETLAATRELCGLLLDEFDTSEYRGFPAKNEIPGNANWKRHEWRQSHRRHRLLDDPALFLNLGFETMANEISHPDPQIRREVNRYAIDMSLHAHELDRVRSYLTIPVVTDGEPLVDDETADKLRVITARYAPDLAPELTPGNLADHRRVFNSAVPKDS
ncbi:MAG: hypothetical protein ACJ786_14720 [Catenulispora sp.]